MQLFVQGPDLTEILCRKDERDRMVDAGLADKMVPAGISSPKKARSRYCGGMAARHWRDKLGMGRR